MTDLILLLFGTLSLLSPLIWLGYSYIGKELASKQPNPTEVS